MEENKSVQAGEWTQPILEQEKTGWLRSIKTKEKREKTVAYAYASSTTASKLGYGSSGCYYACIINPSDNGDEYDTQAGPTLEEALAIASNWPQDWNKYSLR